MAHAAHLNVVATKPLKSNQFMMRFFSYALLALVFFLLGFLPLWANARDAAQRHAETARELRLVQLQTALGSAVVDAQRGAHEPALESVSSFFTALQTAIASGEGSDFSAAQRAALQPLLGGRDEIIALLARGDPAGADRLSALYRSFSQILTGHAALGAAMEHRHGREMIQTKRAP
jgi:hypothetical protein